MNQGSYQLLFVCTGNICRSAYADVVAAAQLPPSIQVSSAGTHALLDHPIDAAMAAALGGRVAGTNHRARQLNYDLAERADLIIAMATEHRRFVMEEWPGLITKTFVIGQVARELAKAPAGMTLAEIAGYLWQHRSSAATDDVADPYRLGEEAAQQCAQTIDHFLAPIVDYLNAAAKAA